MVNQRGAVLGIVVLIAIIGSIAAYTVLMLSVAGARQSLLATRRTQARYLAEAAMVVAMQQLWAEAVTPYPGACVPGTDAVTTELLDTDGDGTGDAPVEVTVTNCGPGGSHAVAARVMY